MRTVLLASLRTHTRRYVAAVLAVAIAVAFVVVTDALASSARGGLTGEVGKPYEKGDLVVTGGGLDGWPNNTGVEAVVDLAEERGDAAVPLAQTWLTVERADGSTVATDAEIGTWADDPSLVWQDVVEGRGAEAPDEAVVSASQARARDVAVGDELVVGSGEGATTLTVVGLADGTRLASSALWVPFATMRTLEGWWAETVTYAVAPGGDVDAAADAIAALGDDGSGSVDADVETTGLLETFTPAEVADDRLQQANQQVDVMAMLVLLFAAIAAVVSVMVIANTFSILFAQRLRDLALLRCVGATRRQVRRAIRLEALVVGLLASLTGLALGAALGYGGVALLRASVDFPLGAVRPSPLWWGAAFLGGVVTTVVAAWLPTRTATRVSPLAALRPEAAPSVRTTAGRARIALGGLVLVAGGVGLALAVATANLLVMVAGGTAFFAGVVLLGPVVVPALLRLVGLAVRRTGPAARIAGDNAVRNPRRTAATTASLLIGVTLTTAVLTGMASARSATAVELDQQFPVDVTVAADAGPLDADLADRLAEVRGVDAALVVPGGLAAVAPAAGTDTGGLPPEEVWSSDTLPLAAPAAAEDADGSLDEVVRGDRTIAAPADDEIAVPYDVVGTAGVPERVEVTTAAGTRTLTPRLVDSGWGSAALVSPATLQALVGDDTEPYAVWLRADDGADVDDLVADLEAAASGSGAGVTPLVQQRDWVDTQLDVVVMAVVGLLGIGVLIALVGIGSTLGLSVLERARENALLRALGLTRRQLRRTLAAEGVLLSVVATLLGTAVGVFFAVIGVRVMVQPAIGDAALVLPWGQLAAVVAVAALAGLVACVLPARRAARISPAAGLTAD
ncbi:FtsX-like permease family protein [Nocardioides sp. ChNu-153]|uniref:ABC transporter permease n=1 Tax=unclassified Nocardioides TaxID=2615069 RepID=UPI002405C869|nr:MULTISPECIES: FtsX-like permease family protein [unclassified Nocardioides]MDF9715757.1 FtsX-like permease family protein [Nocardioides sp. ChNu-99]MDN7121862.1 FtsX-like permease family protein [Nocardioides sp. ChNu-153]